MADNVKDIGIKFKKPGDDTKMLSLVREKDCFEHAYIIDPESDTVECHRCGKAFNPMSVLVDLARKESRWMMNLRDYKDKMKRLSKRQRTKCNNCGKMTAI